MFNLSQVDDQEQIKRIYTEALTDSIPRIRFSLSNKKRERDDMLCIEVSKAGEIFFYLILEGDLDTLSGEDMIYLRNSVGLLAVIIQNRRYSEALEQHNIKLKETVDERSSFIDSLIRVVPAMIYIYDIQTKENVYQNEGGKKILGYTDEEIRQLGTEMLYNITHPDDYPKLMKHHKQLLIDDIGTIRESEFRLKDSEGNWHWVLAKNTPYKKDENGKTTRILGCALDVTKQMHDQQQLECSLSQIEELQRYLSNVINSMPSVLVGVNMEGVVTQWNDSACQATGIPAKKAVGLPLERVFSRLAGEMEQIRRAMQTKEVLCKPRQRSEEGGIIRYDDITIYPLIENGMEGAVIRMDDVTERVQIEEMMVQSEKMMSVGGLAAGMAHEINNPLAGVIQTASILENRLGFNHDIPANHKAAESVGTTIETISRYMVSRDIPRMLMTIRESGVRMASIVKNMLSFARQSVGQISSHDLSKVLDATLKLAETDYDLKNHYDFKQIEIVREYEKDLLPIPCEKAKIQQVFLNLLRNGAQAMQDEGIKKPLFILRARTDKTRNQIVVEVEDNGPGMDEETRKRIFEPFFTTKPVGVGTGLGLSISYFIITKSHGGEVLVESTPGKGTNFIIRLPMQRNAPKSN